METYLSDAFINTVLSKEELIDRFFSGFKDFKNESVNMSELYQKAKDVHKIARNRMLDVLYHNIPKVNGMYKDILDVEFPVFGHIIKAVDIRHHTVHRNGRDKEGNAIEIKC